MFTAEEARILAKEVKDKKELLVKQEQENKKQKAIEEAKPIIEVYLENIKRTIAQPNQEKDYIVENLENLDDLVIDEIITSIRDLGFIVKRDKIVTTNKPDYQTLTISWKEEKLIKPKLNDKEINDLIKSIFDKPIDYFGYPYYRPIRCFSDEFPNRFFL
jgi:hypothetical protein